MNVFIFPIEPIESRYSAEWYRHIPRQLEAYAKANSIECSITTIKGKEVTNVTTPNAFLNFCDTNIYKSTQLANFCDLFRSEQVPNGSKILVTDAWNVNVCALRYISDLLGMNFEIHSMWHAGSYDPSDILGFTIKDKKWSYNLERAIFHASDYNYFATDFHETLFETNLGLGSKFRSSDSKSLVVGWPMEYLKDLIKPKVKRNLVLFPHRLNSDKQPNIFRELRPYVDSSIDMVLGQELSLSKDQYHNLLGETKVVFSCALHENLGISMYEGYLAGAIPLAPSRCSYKEIFRPIPQCLYPSEWTEPDTYKNYLEQLGSVITHVVNTYDSLININPNQFNYHKYFDGTELYKRLLDNL